MSRPIDMTMVKGGLKKAVSLLWAITQEGKAITVHCY
jgi:hypothetical protein